MLRVFTMLSIMFATASGIASPAQADPFARLDQASQTATVEQDGVQLIAFYNERGPILDLTVLITDQDGEALRTRIGLRNRQHHTLLLPSESAQVDSTRIDFMRTDQQIEMVVSNQSVHSDYSANQNRTHF